MTSLNIEGKPVVLKFGIYGFEITRTTSIGPLTMYPRYTKFTEAKRAASDRKCFNLTAVGEFVGVSERAFFDIAFDLSASLTFCQQQWVEVTGPYEAKPTAELMEMLPAKLALPFSRPTRGALIESDAFNPDARRGFLTLCMSKLADRTFDDQTNIHQALFRHAESWRLRQSFIDLTYYMDFSALEILARTAENDYQSDVAPVTAAFLQKLGFGVTQTNIAERHLGMQNYAHVRNALFHNGELEKTVNENGKQVTLGLVDYEDHLRALVPDVILKVLRYDDPSINWNRWIDRMPFRGARREVRKEG